MTKDSTTFSRIIENIYKTKDIKYIKDAFINSFISNKTMVNNDSGYDLNILILNTPCHGSGDIVFAIKLANYLREWYNAKVTIATTQVDKFKSLGETRDLLSLVNKKGFSQCRRFKLLKLEKHIPKQDLIFVAPMQSDYDPSLSDVKYLIPYATKFNTFFFSEYNHDGDDRDFDFPTGVGSNKYGLLFTKIPKHYYKQNDKLRNPYAFVYIAESVDDADLCFFSFVEMVAAKYHKKYKKLDIVIPPSILKFITEDKDTLIRKLKKYYGNISYVTKDEEFEILEGDSNNFLTFRVDILPAPNTEFLGLMENSIKDILVTGDQSITDALSCCSSKNIWYQIAPWKEGFGKELAKHLPNKYFKSYRTSCGTLKAIRYNSKYKEFVKDWDFRYLAKPKMDAIIKFTNYRNDNKKTMEGLENVMNSSRNMLTLLNKLKI